MRFPQWVARQPRGILKRIELEHGVGYNTLARVMRGEILTNYTVAKRISDATSGAVSVPELCEAPTARARRGRAPARRAAR